MSDTCDACRAPVDTKGRITCTKCTLAFHLACVKILTTEATTDFRTTWICPNCRCNEPKGDNSNTPIRSTTSKPVKAVTERQKKIAAAAASGTNALTTASACDPSTGSRAAPSPVLEQPPSEMSLILSEIRLLRQDMNDFKQQIKEVTASCNRRMDEFDKSLFAAAHRIAELEAAQSEHARMSEHIIKLEETIQRQVQGTTRNELEIVGIPENPNENLVHVIKVFGSKIGENLQEGDIDWIERVGPKSSKHGSRDEQRSRLVVVRFLRRANRDSYLKAAKARRNLTPSDILLDGSASKIFVNERLTKTCRQLFQEARRRSKSLGVAYCWTRNGTVFIRRAEGRPAVAIRNLSDMDRFLKQSELSAGQISTPTTSPAAVSQ